MNIKLIFFALFLGQLQAGDSTKNSTQLTPEKNPLSSFLNVSFNLVNNNSNSLSSEMQQASVQKQTNEQSLLVDPRLLALTDVVKRHWLGTTCTIVGVCAFSSYMLLFAYIMRNKSWIHYATDAWHCWRSDVSIDVLKQVDPSLTARELWKTIQNKYLENRDRSPNNQAADCLTLFINETSYEIDRLNTFIETCNTIEKRYLFYIIPTITHSRSLASEKLSRLQLMQHAVTNTVVAALTNPI